MQESRRVIVRWDDGLTAVLRTKGGWTCDNRVVENVMNTGWALNDARVAAHDPLATIAKELTRAFRGASVELEPAKR